MKSMIKKFSGLALTVVLALAFTGCPGNVEKEHSFSEEWTKDATHHWHAATCEHSEEVDGKTAHEFGEWSEGKRVCSVCGYEQLCEHTWDAGKVTKEATVGLEGEKKYICTVCNETKTDILSALGWCESPIDVDTGAAATSSSKYVYFGVFPKNVLPRNTTVTIYEKDFVEMGSNKYFKGSDGEYYVLTPEHAYIYTTGVRTDNTYTDGSSANAKYSSRYFKVEPIKWKVLTTDYNKTKNALLLAEDVLISGIPYYEDSKENRNIGENSVYPNNYKHSQIRAYLNGLTYQGTSKEVAKWNGKGFLQTAFTETAQETIATISVDNSGESTSDATGAAPKADGTYDSFPDYTCESTEDKIFLLSEKEVSTTEYGFAQYESYGSETARIKKATDYAKANYVNQTILEGSGANWWLRSPSYNDYDKRGWRALLVSNQGSANGQASAVTSDINGIVPALAVSLQ